VIEGLHWELINFKTAHSFKVHDLTYTLWVTKKPYRECHINYSTLQTKETCRCASKHARRHSISLSLSLSLSLCHRYLFRVIFHHAVKKFRILRYFCTVTLYYKYYWLTMWSRALLQKRNRSSASKEIQRSLWNLDVHCLIHNPLLSLLWARWIQSTLTSLFLKIHYNIMFSSTPRSFKWSHSLILISPRNSCWHVSSLHTCHIPIHMSFLFCKYFECCQLYKLVSMFISWDTRWKLQQLLFYRSIVIPWIKLLC